MITAYLVENLGDEVDEDVLTKAFSIFPSFKMAKSELDI